MEKIKDGVYVEDYAGGFILSVIAGSDEMLYYGPNRHTSQPQFRPNEVFKTKEEAIEFSKLLVE